jgi:hypothetical protein
VGEHDPRRDRVEAVEQGPDSVGDMPSAIVVEPRMSANSMDAAISAPPWWVEMNEKHWPQVFGFWAARFLPISRIAAPPGPLNGAAQRWQRGSEGRCLNTIRRRRSSVSPFVRNARQ